MSDPVEYDKTLTEWFEGYAFTEPTITLDRTDFPEISEAQADAATGDIANFVYGFLDKVYAEFAKITPTSNRPVKWFISKSLSPNVVTGKDTVQFTVRFTTGVAAGSRNVLPEPVEE